VTPPGGPAILIPRRIMIMGPPGSGKSTLARQLGDALSLPVAHLDALHHAPGWLPRPRADFYADVARVVAQPCWVIDGNYTSASAGRLARADLVVLLDLPRHITMTRLLKRIARGYGRVRPDSAPGCPERLDWSFLGYAWTWRRAIRPRILAAIAGYEPKTRTFSDQCSVDRFATALLTPQVRALAP